MQSSTKPFNVHTVINSESKTNFSLRAILSERANYIVSKMALGCDFSAALLEAQQNWNGDTTKDYEGRDTVGRLAALVEHCCGVKIPPQEIFCRGIAFLSPLDFEMANYFGRAIKYLGVVRALEGRLDVRMHATMVSKKDPLSLVSGAQTGVEWNSGPSGLGGRDGHCGLLADSVGVSLEALPHWNLQGLQLVNILELHVHYYIRFTIQDSLEAISSITKVLSDHRVGIQHLHKKGQQPGSIVPLIVVTHEADERNIREALKEIDGMGFVTQMTKMIRIDE